MSKQIFEHKGYKGSVEHDLEHDNLFGKLLFIRDLVTYEAETVADLRAAFREAVDEYLEDCEELGREPNITLSGTFQVRTGPELHEYAATQAANEGIKMNEWFKNLVAAHKNGKVENHYHQTTHEHTHIFKSELKAKKPWESSPQRRVTDHYPNIVTFVQNNQHH